MVSWLGGYTGTSGYLSGQLVGAGAYHYLTAFVLYLRSVIMICINKLISELLHGCDLLLLSINRSVKVLVFLNE